MEIASLQGVESQLGVMTTEITDLQNQITDLQNLIKITEVQHEEEQDDWEKALQRYAVAPFPLICPL